MKTYITISILVFAILTGATSTALAASFSKVMIVVLENTNYDEAVKLPYLSKLAGGGALFTNFHGVFHPSQPNYVAMTSGSLDHVYLDNEVTIYSPNVVDLLEHAGKSWKVYAEDYPGNCFTGMTSGRYARKHNPFISYQDIQDVPARCARIVNAGQLQQDIEDNKLPDYSFFVPNLDDDGHDSTPAFSDQWLQKTFEPLFRLQNFSKGLLFVVTFDESETYTNNHIFTLFYGAGVKPGTASNRRYNHISVLKTIESQWNLGSLHLFDEFESPITDIWR